jgi:HSP20 family protein
MTLIRWNQLPVAPARDLVQFENQINGLFNDLWSRGWPGAEAPSEFTPAIDVEETPEGFVLRADLPGLQPKDVQVSLMGDTLTLRGERKQEQVRQEGHYRRIERALGQFERSFKLHGMLRADQVKATYKDGVLEIHVPKAEEAKRREIEIQIG